MNRADLAQFYVHGRLVEVLAEGTLIVAVARRRGGWNREQKKWWQDD